MMQIYICDDEPQILKLIVERIRHYLPNDRIKAFSSGRELMEAMSKVFCDILFLDIDMQDINGMDIARWLNDSKQRPLLVFVTSHDELVYESLQYHPFGFIRKSHFSKEIGKILDDCRKELDSHQKHFHFRMSGQEVVLLVADILYFEADGNYLKAYTVSGQYRFRSTVAAVENNLAAEGFVRVHKGFLVKLSAIRIFGNENLILINGEEIPLGKNYADRAKKCFLQSMR